MPCPIIHKTFPGDHFHFQTSQFSFCIVVYWYWYGLLVSGPEPASVVMSGDCALCGVEWRPDTSEVWGPSVASLQQMKIKMESHKFKPFNEASVDYANK